MLGRADLVFIFIVGSIAAFCTSFPLHANVTKYRAHYAPKRIELDEEDSQLHSGVTINSYSTMIKRVWKVEGGAGLYKGIIPSLLYFIMQLSLGIVLGIQRGQTGGIYYMANIWHKLAYGFVLMIITLPVRILILRAITTPYKLPSFNAVYSLRMLLTTTERRHPWILFLTPGLLISETLLMIHQVLIMGPLLSGHIPFYTGLTSPFLPDLSLTRLSTFVGVSLVVSITNCPLAVITTRLFIQRNHSRAVHDAIVLEGQEGMIDAAFSGAEEDVISMRNESDPYVGFVDCAKRIVADEGYSTLFRAWGYEFVLLWLQFGTVFLKAVL